MDWVLRAERIQVADVLVAAEAQLLEIRSGFHGLTGDEATLLRAHLTSATAVVRSALKRKQEDQELAIAGRFPGVYRRRGGGAAREGTAAGSSFEVEDEAALRPRAAVGAISECVLAERRCRVRQTLQQAKETRKQYNANLRDYRAPALQLEDLGLSDSPQPSTSETPRREVRFAEVEEEPEFDPWDPRQHQQADPWDG